MLTASKGQEWIRHRRLVLEVIFKSNMCFCLEANEKPTQGMKWALISM